MINSIQSFYESLGKYGCYYLLLLQIGQRELTANDLFFLSCQFHENNFLHFNKNNLADTENFFVKNPAKILEVLTGKKYTVRKEPATYEPKENETEILFYALNQKNADKGIGHFRMKEYDTLQNSNTVKKGKVYSKRIIKEIK